LRRIVKIDEEKCDGCGACIPACPEGALQIINGKAKLVKESLCDGLGACVKECPKGALIIEEREAEPFNPSFEDGHHRGHEHESLKVERRGIINWPVKLELMNPRAPIFDKCELVISADCVPFVYGDFKEKLSGKVVLSGCPIFGDKDLYRDKIAGMLKHNNILSLTVLRMEVPCCSGLTSIVNEAIRKSGKHYSITERIVSIKGDLKR